MVKTTNNISSASKRIHWIDYAKAWAIFCVVMIHIPPSYGIKSWLCTWLVPFFFFISGFLFKPDKTPDFKSFMLKSIRQLVIPYLSIGILIWLLWVTVMRHLGEGADAGVEWWQPLVNLFLGIPEGIVHDIPLWNILCIFVAKVFYWLLFRNIPLRFELPALLLFGGVGTVIAETIPITLPWCLGIMPVAVMFFGLGSCCHRNDIMKARWWLVIICLVVTVVISIYNPMARVFRAQYDNLVLFSIGGFCGIYAMFGLCRYISCFFGERLWISFISTNTLLICGFHLTAFALVKGVMLAVGLQLDVVHSSLITEILFAVISMLLLIPLIKTIRRWLPFMVGSVSK